MSNIDLNTIASIGENYRIEFKASIDKTFVEEVTAFANASGGTLYFGIDDDGEIKGVDISNNTRSRIQDAISKISPNLHVELKIIDHVIAVIIPEGEDKPYMCPKGFYLRMGANSQKLERNDIIELFKYEGKIRFDEMIVKSLDFNQHFDCDAYAKFIRLAKISDVLETKEVLTNLDCGNFDDEFLFNHAGMLFFTKQPTSLIKQAAVVCALYKGTDKVTVLDKKNVEGNILELIEGTILFFKKHLKMSYRIEGLRREDVWEIPEVALREAVTNAICHRDYFEKGAQVMAEIFDDRVVISNPGGLAKGLDVSNFGRISVTRNPIIASLLEKSDYIEKMGTGIQRIKLAMSSKNLSAPAFEFDGFFIF